MKNDQAKIITAELRALLEPASGYMDRKLTAAGLASLTGCEYRAAALQVVLGYSYEIEEWPDPDDAAGRHVAKFLS
jgi:hypothetical protein